MESHKILSIEDRAVMLLEALEYNNVDNAVEAMGESIIVKDEFEAPILSVKLARIGFKDIQNKNNEYNEKISAIKRGSKNIKLSVVSIGGKVDSVLGNKLEIGDEIIIDSVSSSYGILKMNIPGNNRLVERVCLMIGDDSISDVVIEKAKELDTTGVFVTHGKDSYIKIVNYMKISTMHVAARIRK